ncbi:hypothetical protein LFZ55_14730 [Salmonella enterica subsp. diarizonae serovar 65:c:z str. SA20044251]|nr:hypothetical protein LFZ55_14730 [Salmonella enterica subsp. diarizonae serovar 65:c:z str. SA20044251]
MLSLAAPMLHGLKEAPEELRMAAPTGEYLRKHRLAGHCDRGHTLPTIRPFAAPAHWSEFHDI